MKLAASKGGSLTAEQQKKVLILGLCNEILQAYFLVADDIMDGSTLRLLRQKPLDFSNCDLFNFISAPRID